MQNLVKFMLPTFLASSLLCFGVESEKIAACASGSCGMHKNHSMMAQEKEERKEEIKLLSNLDKEHRALYHSLNAEGKKLALELARKGCENEEACLGQEKDPYQNINIAVEIAAKYMEEKKQMQGKHMLHNGMKEDEWMRKNEKINKMNGVQ